MSGLDYQRVKEIFAAVVDLPANEQGPVLDNLCSGDTALRSEVESLLKHNATPLRGLSTDAAEIAFSLADEQIPEQIGSYRIIRKLGEGGMGVVYLAEQEQPRRSVALKLISSAVISNRVRHRFARESEALGKLQHPGIAQIIEAGTATIAEREQPFFAMEYVDGVPLTAFADARTLTTRERLELIARICDGVHHAHERAVVHRDLKPANILVTTDGDPRILDFGIARLTDSDASGATLQTQTGELIGTLPYMSPEQVSGTGQIDARTDVYALGAILFELLTGRLPHDLAGHPLPEAIRVIATEEPTTLSSVSTAYRGDVDTIVAKSLDKDPARRYQSAADFGADIRRYLDSKPIVARPASTIYQFSKFARRNKALVGGVVAVLLVSMIGTTVSILFAIGETRQRSLADKRAAALEQVTSFQAQMISDIDAASMGEYIEQRLREISLDGATGTEPDGESLHSVLANMNSTNLAVEIIDQHILADSARTVDEAFEDQPLVRAALLQTIANAYRRLGVYDRAEPLQDSALALRTATLGAEHPDTLISFGDRGFLLWEMGRFEEAEQIISESIELHRRIMGPDHPRTLTSMANLGMVLRAQDRFEETLPLYEAVLDARRRVLGEDHDDTVNAIISMAVILRSMGRPNEAEEYYNEALERGRRVQGSDAPDLLTTINNTAHFYREISKYDEAEQLFNEALEGRRRVLGDNHRMTLMSLSGLGSVAAARGQYEKAASLYADITARSAATIGERHPDTLKALNWLAAMNARAGRYKEAEIAFRKLVSTREQLYGPSAATTLVAKNNLAFVLDELGKYNDAIAIYQASLDIYLQTLAPDHPNVCRTKNNLASCLESLGRLDEALTYYREALDGRTKTYGDTHPDTLTSVNNVAGCLSKMGRHQEALPLYEQALKGRRTMLGEDHPNTIASVSNLSRVLRRLGRLEESESYGAEAVRIGRTALSEGHWMMGVFLTNHGRALSALGRFTESEMVLKEAHQILTNTFDDSHQHTHTAAEALAILYEQWHAAEPGGAHDVSAKTWRSHTLDDRDL